MQKEKVNNCTGSVQKSLLILQKKSIYNKMLYISDRTKCETTMGDSDSSKINSVYFAEGGVQVCRFSIHLKEFISFKFNEGI